ncbi:hypothetical protein A5651_01740 [Mycobacterium sp. 1274761.0]|nr:hypothetical protein A5651_01740 [Mycobacterium sp. 1274761.0]
MAYVGKHRVGQGGLGPAKVAGLAGVAATTAAILSVGFGAGPAQALPGWHKHDSDKKPGQSAPADKAPAKDTSSNTAASTAEKSGETAKSVLTTNAATTNATTPSLFGNGFGQVIIGQPKGNYGIFNYFVPGANGTFIKGLCLNPSGCS